MENKLLTTTEVSIILGCTSRYVLYLNKEKKINSALTLANGNYLFHLNDIITFKNLKNK